MQEHLSNDQRSLNPLNQVNVSNQGQMPGVLHEGKKSLNPLNQVNVSNNITRRVKHAGV